MTDKSRDAFRTISEVADWLDVPAHVLRFWESKFSQIKPVKRAGGRRYYRPGDMLLIGGIKKLLHEDGMTIRGVQKMLKESGVKAVSANSRSLDFVDDAASERTKRQKAKQDAKIAESAQSVTEDQTETGDQNAAGDDTTPDTILGPGDAAPPEDSTQPKPELPPIAVEPDAQTPAPSTIEAWEKDASQDSDLAEKRGFENPDAGVPDAKLPDDPPTESVAEEADVICPEVSGETSSDAAADADDDVTSVEDVAENLPETGAMQIEMFAQGELAQPELDQPESPQPEAPGPEYPSSESPEADSAADPEPAAAEARPGKDDGAADHQNDDHSETSASEVPPPISPEPLPKPLPEPLNAETPENDPEGGTADAAATLAADRQAEISAEPPRQTEIPADPDLNDPTSGRPSVRQLEALALRKLLWRNDQPSLPDPTALASQHARLVALREKLADSIKGSGHRT